jgi:predicted dehydrogenase
MRYLFRDRWREVPCYAPYRSCALVEVRLSFPVARVAPHDQRAIARDWRKVLSFVRAEGPVATWRKVRSKREQELLTSDFHVVVAVGTLRGEEAPVICLGTRHPRCAEHMLFHRDLTVRIDRWPSEEELARAVQKVDPMRWQSVAGYNFYSDQPPPPEAIRLIQAVAEALAEQDTDAPTGRAKPVAPVRSPAQALEDEERTRGGVAIISAGDYARTQIIPALRRAGARLDAIVDLEPLFAAHVKEEYGFSRALTDWREAIRSAAIEFVVVASYHDTHALIASEAARHGKKVLVEKPPAITREDLQMLLDAMRDGRAFIEVGFNRRFAPLTRQARKLLDKVAGPVTLICRVKEVEIPDAHWYRWPKEGTRIAGNLCHWIDLAVHFLGDRARPTEIALSPQVTAHPDEERTLTIAFDDGSVAAITATSRGDATLGVQERIELRRDQLTIEIEDYRALRASWKGKPLARRRGLRDKGHRAMYLETFRRAQKGERPLYSPRDLFWTTTLTIRATEMARAGERSSKVDCEAPSFQT